VAFGVCDAARFNAGEYAVALPGPSALAVHVLDGIGAGEVPAEAVEIGDPAVVGAEVTRGGARTFVVASSAKDGAAGPALAYKAAGDRPARHVVFDAPEDDAGKSIVAATGDSGACKVTIKAGGGDGALDGRPLVFQLGAAPDCAITEDKGALPDTPPAPGAPSGGGNAPGTTPSDDGGHGCRANPARPEPAGILAIIGLLYVTVRSRRRDK
jgi:hypothetical protein